MIRANVVNFYFIYCIILGRSYIVLRFNVVLFFILAILLPKFAFATYPDISGTYSGSISGIDTSCVNPADDGPFSGSLSLSIIADTMGNISGGSGVFVNSATGEVDNLTITGGGFLDADTFDLNFTISGGGTGNLQFDLSGSTITVATGSVSDDCISVINSGSLTNTNGRTLVSSETPSSNVTEAILFNTQIQNSVTGISKRVTGALSALRNFITPRFSDNQFKMEGAMGLNAGDGIEVPYGVWGNYSYTNYENDLSSTAFDGSTHGFLGGIDFQVWDRTVIGVAFGYDKGDVDTAFNNGNQDTDTVTIAPYFGAILSDILSVDFNIGYSYVDYDQYRTTGGTRVSSTPSADRWFSAFNLNAITFIDHWVLGGRVGMLYASSVIDSYTESNNIIVAESRTKVGTISIAGDVAYSFNEWEPFLNMAYQYDYQLQEIVATTGPQPSNDNNDILLTTGVRYFEKSGLSGNLEYSKRLLRDDYDEDRISLTIRIDY